MRLPVAGVILRRSRAARRLRRRRPLPQATAPAGRGAGAHRPGGERRRQRARCVRSASSRRATSCGCRSRSGGVVERVTVDVGDRVQAGQVLAVLKRAEVDAAVSQAAEGVEKARRDLERARQLRARRGRHARSRSRT